jgi:hypothetical protein
LLISSEAEHLRHAQDSRFGCLIPVRWKSFGLRYRLFERFHFEID